MKTFPKPLSTKEEQTYLVKLKQGDKNARNILIEKNLRLEKPLKQATVVLLMILNW